MSRIVGTAERFLQKRVSLIDDRIRQAYKQAVASSKGPFYADLGARIRGARKLARVTQERLATAVGLSRASIVNIEKGRQPLAVETLVAIAHALNAPASSLIPERHPPLRVEADKLQHLSPAARVWVTRVIAPDPNKNE